MLEGVLCCYTSESSSAPYLLSGFCGAGGPSDLVGRRLADRLAGFLVVLVDYLLRAAISGRRSGSVNQERRLRFINPFSYSPPSGCRAFLLF